MDITSVIKLHEKDVILSFYRYIIRLNQQLGFFVINIKKGARLHFAMELDILQKNIRI